MNKITILAAGLLVVSVNVFALSLTSNAFQNNGIIPYENVYCMPDGNGSVKQGGDISPDLKWNNVPPGTKSFALIVSDPDSAKVGYFDSHTKNIALSERRTIMYHWVVADIPAKYRGLPKGTGANGFVRGNMTPGRKNYGLTGFNIYNLSLNMPLATLIAFGENKGKDMKGKYGGYGGMCAPFNDEMIHNYIFTLYALDIEKVNLPESGYFSGDDLTKTLEGHVIEKAILVGKSITNPKFLDYNLAFPIN
jgi:Raf kinase inhibitor-like YbhB/YbcL family protein